MGGISGELVVRHAWLFQQREHHLAAVAVRHDSQRVVDPQAAFDCYRMVDDAELVVRDEAHTHRSERTVRDPVTSLRFEAGGQPRGPERHVFRLAGKVVDLLPVPIDRAVNNFGRQGAHRIFLGVSSADNSRQEGGVLKETAAQPPNCALPN